MAWMMSVASGATESENSPLLPELVPLLVPRSITVEPGRASPELPTTRPVTGIFWAWASSPASKKTKSSKRFFIREIFW